MRSALRLLPALSVLTIALTGCSSSSKPNTQENAGAAPNQLLEVAGLLRDYSTTYNRGPAKAADLAPFESTYPFGYQAVKSGQIEVVWSATVAGEGGGGSDAIVAYEKKVPAEGGYVLLESGKVKEMKPAEFQSAPKAGKR
jgi:hypothetical protein